MKIKQVTHLTHRVDHGSVLIERPTGEVTFTMGGHKTELPKRWQDGVEYTLVTKRRAELMSICRAAGADALDRLESGDLEHIGGAILTGETIRMHGGKLDVSTACFKSPANLYTIAPERITVGDVPFPKPLSEAPGVGAVYWVAGLEGVYCREWDEDEDDLELLRSRVCHSAKEAAEEHRRALIKLSGGEV